MTKVINALRKEWAILSILFIGFLLRVWALDFQSLWLDELHNMTEADPNMPWSTLFHYLKCCDQHPPLYFIIERLAFTIFGHTSGVARSVSMIAGTVSIWGMYLLGKEIFNKNLGYLAAILTTVNYFNIMYSQEARGYIFLFLFAVFSFLYLIRLIKSPVRKNIILYIVFTLLMLYSHYYSLFAAVSQGVLALVFIFLEEKGPARAKLFKAFLIAGIFIGIGYAPWVPFMLEMSNIKSFWIGPVEHDFMITYFKGYFGDAKTVIPILVVLLIVYIIHFSITVKDVSSRTIKNSPLHFSFIIALIWIFVSCFIPYLRSILVVPMLFMRYTIVILPAILLVLAYGIELFKVPLIKYGITALLVILSLTDIVISKKYYTDVHKTQFREMTAFVVEENKDNYPIINEVTAWHQEYYLKLMGSKAKVLTGSKDALVDSIVRKGSPQWDLEGFWVVGAHGEQPLKDEKVKALEERYMMLKSNKYFDAWAQLFVSKTRQTGEFRVVNYTDFPPNEGTVLPDQGGVMIWGGAIRTKTMSLDKGAFTLTITSMGYPAKDEFPHLNIYCNDKKIGDFYVTGGFTPRDLTFENTSDSAVFKLEMDNDFSQEGKGDRNALIQTLIFKKNK